MESANAIFEFLQDEGLENLRRDVIEFVGRNLGRVEKRNRMNGLAYLLTQSFCKTA
jgi:cobalamin biosynthesis protein CobD/CbiB